MDRGGRTQRLVVAAIWSVALSTLAASGSCVAIDGGAVEVAWAIFSPDGRAITDCACAQPPIAQVRLHLVSDPDGNSEPCAGNTGCRFSCRRKIGATPFMIPPGQYLMSLVPVGADGSDLDSTVARTPPAQSRAVVRGQPTQLEAFEIETSCSDACSSGTTQPCTGG